MGTRRVWPPLAVRAAIIVALMLLLPASAAAHAVLVEATPSDESTTEGSVRSVELRFDENVNVAFGGVKAWGPDGSRADRGAADGDGKIVRLPVSGDATGTYAVSYRVVSSDGHPVRGALTFHVRERSANAASERAAKAASATDRRSEWAYGTARGAALLSLMIIAGGVIFACCIAPGTRPRLLGWALTIAVVGLVASFFLDARNATGLPWVELVRGEVIRSELGTTWGRSVALQLGLLVVLAVWLRFVDLQNVRGIGRGLLVSTPAIAPLLAWSVGGHAIADDPVWVRLPLDMLHMVMAAAWFGGLVQLLGYLRYDAVTVEHVERYSRWMPYAVGVLVLTGLYAAWSEIGISREALADTTYGRLVVVKSLLLVGTVPLALLNRRRHVPGLRGAGGQHPNDARRALRGYVMGEIALLALVLAATAALIQTPPARTSVDPGIVDKDVRLDSGGRAQLVLDPARAGSNEIHVYVATADDRLDDEVTDVTLRADGPRGIENLKLPLLPSGPGHFTTPSRTIPFAGTWTFELVVRRGRFETETETVQARIGGR